MNKDYNCIMKRYLEEVKGRKIRVFVSNGYQLCGVLRYFDEVSIRIEDSKTGKDKLIFIFNISTIEEED